ncbi:hypothetical protein D9M70_584280 [compost metagenome]
MPYYIGSRAYVLDEVGDQGGAAALDPGGGIRKVLETDHVLLLFAECRMSNQPNIEHRVPCCVVDDVSFTRFVSDFRVFDAP